MVGAYSFTVYNNPISQFALTKEGERVDFRVPEVVHVRRHNEQVFQKKASQLGVISHLDHGQLQVDPEAS